MPHDRPITQRDYEQLIATLQRLEGEREIRVDEILDNFSGAQENDLFQAMKARDHASHQISALRSRLANFTLAEAITGLSTVCVGDCVHLENLQTNDVTTIHIITADMKPHGEHISFDAPLAHELLGQQHDAELVLTIDTPDTRYRIVDIQPMPDYTPTSKTA